MSKIKKLLKLIVILVFLYVAFFSIQNFWQGYHDLDTAFNFLNLGLSQDINIDGSRVMLTETYMRGIDRVTNSFIWLTLDCLLAVSIGYLFGSENEN